MSQIATLGGGCFWCTEAVLENLQGVERVVSGYSGGHVPDPTYEQVCGKQTGHAEVVQVTFDPERISYRDLLGIFFATHNPTTPNRQGNDVGPQYRSIVLYHDDAQRQDAEAVVRELEEQQVYLDPIVTEIVPFEVFYPAEAVHQGYFRRNPAQPYCAYIIEPKVAKLRQQYRHLLAHPATEKAAGS